MADSVNRTLTVEKGMTVNGRLRADGDLEISGFVEGRVSAEGKVRVTRTGVVRADITAQAAHIQGQVVGDVTATDGVEIATGGRLEGDVTAPRLLLREGAAFLGQIAMGPMVATSMTVQESEEAGPEALPAPRPAFESVVPARETTVESVAEEAEPPPPVDMEAEGVVTEEVVLQPQSGRRMGVPKEKVAPPVDEPAPIEAQGEPAAPVSDPNKRIVTVRRKV